MYGNGCTCTVLNGSFPLKGDLCALNARDPRLWQGLLHQLKRQKSVLSVGNGIKAL